MRLPSRGRTSRLLAVAVAVAVAPAGCGLRVDHRSDAPVPPGDPRYKDAVQVRYLGVAGFLIQRGDDVVLTAPLYSNPDLAQEVALPIHPDLARIRRFHPASAPPVDAILVGHAHYDHLMDVPYVWQEHPGPPIYGSATMKRLLAAYDGRPAPVEFPRPVPVLDPARVIALDDPADPAHFKVDTRNCAGQVPSPGPPGRECAPWPARDGDWEYVKPTLRIRALCARHPPQVPGIHQAPGCANAPAARIPERADDYVEGPPLTYLVDFLDGRGAPAFRVYFQDVPSDGALGQVPAALLEERAVDLALLCVGTWNLVEHHDAVSIVRNLRPQNVLLGHWEDFFKGQDAPLSPAPLQPVGEYQSLVRRELGRLDCPAAPVLSLPAPQVLKVFLPRARSCR